MFGTSRFGELIGATPFVDRRTNPLPDLSTTLLIESGYLDRPTKPSVSAYNAEQTGIASDATTSWWSIGVGDDPPNSADPTTIRTVEENLSVNTGVTGELMVAISQLYDSPTNQSLTIFVAGYDDSLPLPAADSQIRIDDELFKVSRARRDIPSTTLEIVLSERGVYDTASTSHDAGASVIFWPRMAHFDGKWDGSPYTINAVSNSGTRESRTQAPPTPVNRAVRPP